MLYVFFNFSKIREIIILNKRKSKLLCIILEKKIICGKLRFYYLLHIPMFKLNLFDLINIYIYSTLKFSGRTFSYFFLNFNLT